jgi:hypothetical protein
MLNTKCWAALKLWPKCFWLKTDLTATYDKTIPLQNDKINLEITIILYNSFSDISEEALEAAASIKCKDFLFYAAIKKVFAPWNYVSELWE